MPAQGNPQTSRDIRTLADAELPTRVRAILESLLRAVSSEFELRLQGMLVEFEQQLFRLADHARNPAVESGYLQTLRNMRLNRADLVPRFLLNVEAALAALERRGAGQAAPVLAEPLDFTRLSLVEHNDMDADLMLRDIAQRGAAGASLPLHLLGQRFGVLTGSPAFDAEQLPLGPQSLCNCMQDASSVLQLPQDSQLLLLRTFERKVMAEYAGIADMCNSELSLAGVLPALTYVPLRTRPASAETPPRDESAAHAEHDSAAPSEPQPARARDTTPRPAHGASPHADWLVRDAQAAAQEGDVSFSLLQDLLAHQRGDYARTPRGGGGGAGGSAGAGSGGGGGSGGGPGGGSGSGPGGGVAGPTGGNPAAARTGHAHAQSATPGAVRTALAQVRSALALSGSGQAPGFATLRSEVVQRLRDAHGPQAALSQADNDTFELLGLLYDRIEREVRADTLSSTLLGQLQVPVLHTALTDRAFFTQAAHPARELLGTVADSGARWLDESDVDPGLMQAMQRAVEHVVRHAHEDTTAFDTSNRVLQAELHLQARRSEMAERRHVESARGKEKLQIAKAQAAETIAGLIGKARPAKFVRALVEQAWADVLTLTLLRHEQDSDEWQAIVGTTRRIVAASCGARPKPDPALAGEVESHLSRVGYHADEAKAIAQRLTSVQGEEEGASRTELAAALKARVRLGERQDHEQRQQVTPRTPEEEAQYDRVRTLPFGTWIEFTVNQQGDVVRKRLSWYSNITGNALFVNLRGQRVGEQTLDSLARMLARGQARVVTVERARVVDRAWQATLAALRNLAGRGTSRRKVQAAT
jgi:uncharacterized membrane protein YgcG